MFAHVVENKAVSQTGSVAGAAGNNGHIACVCVCVCCVCVCVWRVACVASSKRPRRLRISGVDGETHHLRTWPLNLSILLAGLCATQKSATQKGHLLSLTLFRFIAVLPSVATFLVKKYRSTVPCVLRVVCCVSSVVYCALCVCVLHECVVLCVWVLCALCALCALCLFCLLCFFRSHEMPRAETSPSGNCGIADLAAKAPGIERQRSQGAARGGRVLGGCS